VQRERFIFTGILFGVFLHTLAGLVGRVTRLPPRVSLALGVLLFAGLLVLVGIVLVPRVASQADQLVEGLPQAARQLERWLSRYSWGEQLIQRSPFVGDADLPTFDALSRLTGTFSTLFSFLTNIVFVVFIGDCKVVLGNSERQVAGTSGFIPTLFKRRFVVPQPAKKTSSPLTARTHGPSLAHLGRARERRRAVPPEPARCPPVIAVQLERSQESALRVSGPSRERANVRLAWSSAPAYGVDPCGGAWRWARAALQLEDTPGVCTLRSNFVLSDDLAGNDSSAFDRLLEERFGAL